MKNKEFSKLYETAFYGQGYNAFTCYIDDWFEDPSRLICPLDLQNMEINWKTTNHGFLKFFEKAEDQPNNRVLAMKDKTICLENIKVKDICSKNGPRMVIVSGVDKDTFDVITVTFKQIKQIKQEDETYKPEFDKMIIHKANTIKDIKFTSEEVRLVDVLMPDVNGKVSSIIYSEDEDV